MALACFGLHEWAMVYRQPVDEVRHATYPLRLGSAGTDTVVEEHRIACTHHDAFRFFTHRRTTAQHAQPDARDPARLRPAGCLHATMDCYKWAYKLSPFTSAELVADCFALAREVRFVDMRAAPYDLSGLGIEPIRIETPAGKSAYVAAQRDFAERARGSSTAADRRVRPRPHGVNCLQAKISLWTTLLVGENCRWAARRFSSHVRAAA